MKKLILPFLCAALLVTGCATIVDDESQGGGDELAFTMTKDGDRAQGDYNDEYEGSVVVRGTYGYSEESPFFQLIFQLDVESIDLVPQGELFNGAMFFRNADAVKMLGIGELSPEMQECDVKGGVATIKIENYYSNLVEGEAMDSAILAEVIENTGLECQFD